jgi:hypothetical protein
LITLLALPAWKSEVDPTIDGFALHHYPMGNCHSAN